MVNYRRAVLFADYDPDSPRFYDELFGGAGQPWPWASPLVAGIDHLGSEELARRQAAAEAAFMQAGVTFTVYGEEGGTERIFPFDVVPRLITGQEWDRLERGLIQRIEALDLFLADIYGDQKILADKVIPEELIKTCPAFRSQCVGLKPPGDVWCHISGIDLIRDHTGQPFVLEDNVRCPSGVSYVVENRQLLKRTFPRIFNTMPVRPVEDYPLHLLTALRAVAPGGNPDPVVVVLTPGRFNSAYFEHTFLAQQMGVELVEGSDLVVDDGFVHMRTTHGLQRIDVIYRRIDDDYLDPRCFREDSMLGVPGLMDVYQRGNVTLANAPGTGIADDKAVYAYTPKIIDYYLDDEPIIPIVPTHLCSDPSERSYVLENLDKLVVKAVDGAGGYGMLMGPMSTQAERDEFAAAISANPRRYIAQPVLNLSRAPTLIDGAFAGRHVDLRPFILRGADTYVQPGGLTRVALREGSLVVNSSQGGGSKDTWVLGK